MTIKIRLLILLFIPCTLFIAQEKNKIRPKTTLSRSSEYSEERELISKIETYEDVKKIINFLADDKQEGRDPKRKSIHQSIDYIVKQLISYKVKPLFKSYRYSYPLTDSLSGINIAGIISHNKKNNPCIVLTANYDHLGIGPNSSPFLNYDSVFNGANCNASGVAAVLLMAKYFNKIMPEQTIIIALLSGQDYGMIGAGHFADTLLKSGYHVKAVFNFEMLGKNLDRYNDKFLVYQSESSNILELLNSKSKKELFFSEDDDNELFNPDEKSGHFPFHNILKVPSHTFTTFDYENDENYMTEYDNVSNVNYYTLLKNIQHLTLSIFNLLDDDHAFNELKLKRVP
jgi:Zn-dependent M28 family amino/carboxypeptidase